MINNVTKINEGTSQLNIILYFNQYLREYLHNNVNVASCSIE